MFSFLEGMDGAGIKKCGFVRRIEKFQDPVLDRTEHKIFSDIFLTTNEKVNFAALAELGRSSKIPLSCHIGFSGWHNFDLMAASMPEYGIICDINFRNTRLIHVTLQILSTAKDRFDFVHKFTPLVAKSFYFMPNLKFENLVNESDELKGELTRKGSWLSSDSSFKYIQKAALLGKIAALTVDICSTSTFERMGRILQENSIKVTSLYVSNIAQYLPNAESRHSYASSIRALVDGDTKMISARLQTDLECHNAKESDGLIQEMRSGKALTDHLNEFESLETEKLDRAKGDGADVNVHRFRKSWFSIFKRGARKAAE